MSTDTTTTSKTKTIEYEIAYSDRCRLVEQANRFVELMVIKQTTGMHDSSVRQDLVDLSPKERETLDAALDYLKRQFETGFKDTEPFTKKVEITG